LTGLAFLVQNYLDLCKYLQKWRICLQSKHLVSNQPSKWKNGLLWCKFGRNFLFDAYL